MRNESLNNTCILFDPLDEAQQKAIIKFYNDNGWEGNLTNIHGEDCIGVFANRMDYFFHASNPLSKLQVIELPSDYYPTKIVDSESKDDFKKLVEDFANWSLKYPRNRTYPMSKITMDDELSELEKRAKELSRK